MGGSGGLRWGCRVDGVNVVDINSTPDRDCSGDMTWATKRALRKARKAAAAVARLNKRRAEKLGKEPASRKGTAASGRANFSRNLSRKLALNLSKLPAPAARVSEQPLKRVTWSAAPGSRRPMEPSRQSSAGLGPPPGSRPGSKVRFEVRAWTPSGGSR